MLVNSVRSGAGATPARRGWRPAAALLLPLVFLLAACGEADEGDTPVPPAPIPVTTPVAAAPPPIEQPTTPAPAEPAAAPDATPTPPAPVPEPVPTPQPEPVAAPPAEPPAAAPAPAPAEPAVPPAVPTEPAPVPAATPVPATAEAVPPAETDPALVARLAVADADAGRVVAARCAACHAFEAGAPAGVGPNLYDIVGAPVGAAPGLAYSPAFTALAATGATWTYDLLDAFLASPSVAVPGTRMGFSGVPDEVERANLIAYLRTLSDDPVPLPGVAASPLRAEIRTLGLGPVTFTAEQAQIGLDTYARNCSACHGDAFQGIWYGTEWGQAPALAGEAFERRWFVRSLAEFVTAMEETDIINYTSMHDGLSPDRYAAVAAYLLQAYGFAAGEVALPADRATLRGIGFWQ